MIGSLRCKGVDQSLRVPTSPPYYMPAYSVHLHVDLIISYISTSCTLRLPLYILSAFDAYLKGADTGKNVMVMVMVQGTYVL